MNRSNSHRTFYTPETAKIVRRRNTREIAHFGVTLNRARNRLQNA